MTLPKIACAAPDRRSASSCAETLKAAAAGCNARQWAGFFVIPSHKTGTRLSDSPLPIFSR